MTKALIRKNNDVIEPSGDSADVDRSGGEGGGGGSGRLHTKKYSPDLDEEEEGWNIIRSSNVVFCRGSCISRAASLT